MLSEELRVRRCIWRSGKGTEEVVPEAIGNIWRKRRSRVLSGRESGNQPSPGTLKVAESRFMEQRLQQSSKVTGTTLTSTSGHRPHLDNRMLVHNRLVVEVWEGR